MLLSQSLLKKIKLGFLLIFFLYRPSDSKFLGGMKFHFYDCCLPGRTILPSISELSLIASEKLLVIFEMPQDRSPRTELAGRWRKVRSVLVVGTGAPSTLACLHQSPSAPALHFIPGLWFSGSCLWITTGISSCELWLLTRSLSPFLPSCLCCRLHLVAAPVTDPPRPGLHFAQAQWDRTSFPWASFFWDVIPSCSNCWSHSWAHGLVNWTWKGSSSFWLSSNIVM